MKYGGGIGQLPNASSLRIAKISTQIPHYYYCHNKLAEVSYFSENQSFNIDYSSNSSINALLIRLQVGFKLVAG